MSQPDFTAILLAGARAGDVDPLAAEAGVANKSLVPICGAPLIRHVADALAATPGISQIRVAAEPAAWPGLQAALSHLTDRTQYVPAADNLADSVYAAAEGVSGPMLVTTADNVLLTPQAARRIVDAVAGDIDVAVALARQEAVLAAHPEGQRRFYRFADGAFSNCNLYALSGRRALAAAEGFRSGGQFAKKPLRMMMALGSVNLVLLLMSRLSLQGALRRVSRRFRLVVEPVILADGSQAIDVDNARTYRCAEALLLQRRARPTAWAMDMATDLGRPGLPVLLRQPGCPRLS
ncbi:MAG: NTP transferase domain-containing protein [Phenylobacterium sp.]|nr:NTP transferase domain-containing protein [Phenylobacterium sp.]